MRAGSSRYAVVTVFGVALALAGCGDGKQANTQPASAAAGYRGCRRRRCAADIRFLRPRRGDQQGRPARAGRRLPEQGLFTEGSDVKEGELLFAIEKGPYQAAVDQAKAGIVTAEATLKLADIEVGRQTELLAKNVGAQARVDEVVAKQGEANGNLLAQKATLEKAQLQLGYTDVASPISGRIGRANISVGNFVGPSSGTLATIVSQDPIYVSFPVTQREILEIRGGAGSPAISRSTCNSPMAPAMRSPARSTSSTSP